MDEKTTKKRQRSKAYPGTTLEECVQLAIKIKRNLGGSKHSRETLARGMGFSGVSGAVAPRIAALVYFGLLEKSGSEYWLSDESKRVTDPLDADEKQTALRAAVRIPSLYRDLLDKFEPDGRLPEQLSIHLHRFHGIAANAAEKAADIFRQSVVYAGIVNEEGRFVEALGSMQRKIELATDKKSSQPVGGLAAGSMEGVCDKAEKVQSFPRFARSYAFPLSEGRAELHLPEKLSEKDIEILKKQIEILELGL